MSLEHGRIAYATVDPVENQNSLSQLLPAIINSEAGKEVWTKLKPWHCSQFEECTIHQTVSEDTSGRGSRNRQRSGNLMSLRGFDIFNSLLELGKIPQFDPQLAGHELRISCKALRR